MSADHLTVFDVENVILTGRIVQRQRDPESREWKYLFRGRNLTGGEVIVVAKLSGTKTLVIITVYGANLTNGKKR